MMSSKSNWMPSLNALRAFEAVARHGNFQKAADELHVTSPAVQQLVRSLEEALGQRLVVTSRRKLQLTVAAAAAAPLLRSAFEDVASAVNVIRSLESPRMLRISVEPSFAAAWLLPRLGRFQHLHPDIDVFIEASSKIIDLEKGDADIAIRYQPARDSGFAGGLLFEDETIAVCSPKLIERLGEAADNATLSNIPLIHYECVGAIRVQPKWDEWLSAVQLNLRAVKGGPRFTDYNLVMQAAIAGQGLALASKPQVLDAIGVGLLVDALRKSLRNGYGYYVLATPEAAMRDEVLAFLDWSLSRPPLDADR